MFKNNTVSEHRLEYNAKTVPVKVYCERRKNVRYGVARSYAILRLPYSLSVAEQTKHWNSFTAWVYEQFNTNIGLQQRFFGRDYNDGDILEVFGRQYILRIVYDTARTSHQARIKKNEIQLTLAAHDDPHNLRKQLKLLISRCVAHDCKTEFEKRVDTLNDQFFQKDIQQITFKYNLSNWGSCSAKSNLNFSTRLLFAPTETIDYVIIHELAHLIELNHSSRFWDLVSKAMPNYKVHEKWLKVNGHLCDF